MADSMATVVDWYGPYTGAGGGAVRSAQAAAAVDYGPGLYLAIGHGETLRRGPLTMLYMGISSNIASRVTPQHTTLASLSISSIWLGEIGSAGIPGRRAKRTNPNLDIVEWMSAYFLRIPYNDKKRVNPPWTSAVILNRWWQPDYNTPASRPVARWADVIEWDLSKQTANLVWFGRNGKVVSLDHTGKVIRGPS